MDRESEELESMSPEQGGAEISREKKKARKSFLSGLIFGITVTLLLFTGLYVV